MFANTTLAARLTGVLGMMGVLIALVAGVALWQARSMSESTREITANWLPSVKHVNAMNTATSDLRVFEFQHVLNTDAAAMVVIEKDIQAVRAQFDAAQRAYEPLVSSEDERRLYMAFADEWRQYLSVHDELLALSRQNQNDLARSLLEGRSRKLFDSSSDKLMQLVELNARGAEAAGAAAEVAYAEQRNLVASLLVAALLAATVAGAWLLRSVFRQLGAEPAVAAAHVTALAGGDLTRPVSLRPGDRTSLMAKLAAMQSSLAQIVQAVRANAESVAQASAQIAQGNHDLSQRTEEQASALQQTAATMEQLGTTVQHNSEHARQADQLGRGASGVAVQGGDVVGRVVATMQGIHESSRRIGDIIGVIDGIAFQTNILALNAAVEAARAGEQGRGFAVVAAEVRSLAQRSAEAAKEIKALIGRNVDQVEQGTALVDEAGKTMGEIVGSIRRVSDIVSEISSASAEQGTGIAQVGTSISQMDQVTQQNAALVEESAAAAESLKNQAAQLVRAVSVFRLAPAVALAAGDDGTTV